MNVLRHNSDSLFSMALHTIKRWLNTSDKTLNSLIEPIIGSNGGNGSQLANVINCSNGLSNGLSSQANHHQHPHHPHGHPLGLHFAASFPWAAAARGKPRRGMMRRAVFSDAQRQGLEKRFQIQKYISKPDRKKLAEKLGLKDSQVSWSHKTLFGSFAIYALLSHCESITAYKVELVGKMLKIYHQIINEIIANHGYRRQCLRSNYKLFNNFILYDM